MKYGLTLVLTGAIFILSAPSFAQVQTCTPLKQDASVASHFVIKADGIVQDTRTNKQWQRCAIGMQWNGASCEGKSMTFSFLETAAVIAEHNKQKFAGRDNWRMPTRDELKSIVEQRCYNPAINLELFPYSPQSGFWSSTENKGLLTTRMELVHFLNGAVYVANKTQSWRLRLIAD